MSARPRPALERAAARCLVGLAFGFATVCLLAAWFASVRTQGPLGAAGMGLVLGLVLSAAVAFGAIAFRARLLARFSAVRALAMCLAILGPLLVLEGVANLLNPTGYLYFSQCVRYFQWQRYSGVHVSHAHPPNSELELPWGVVRTNAQGWRSGPISERPAPGTLRVLALGDSVVFGWGVDQPQSLCAQLAALLDERCAELPERERVEVLNAGNGSFDSVDELIVFKEHGLQTRPHVAFLLVISNDFDRAPYVDQVEYLAASQPKNPKLIPALKARAIQRPPPLGPENALGKALFFGISRVVNRSFLLSTGRRIALGGMPSGPPAARPEAAKAGSDGAGSEPAPSLEALTERYRYLPEHLEALREVALSCRAAGIPLVLFVYNELGQKRGLVGLLQAELGTLAPCVPLDFPQSDPVRARELVNSATDSHWNAEGSRWFAEQMVGPIVESVR